MADRNRDFNRAVAAVAAAASGACGSAPPRADAPSLAPVVETVKWALREDNTFSVQQDLVRALRQINEATQAVDGVLAAADDMVPTLAWCFTRASAHSLPALLHLTDAFIEAGESMREEGYALATADAAAEAVALAGPGGGSADGPGGTGV